MISIYIFLFSHSIKLVELKLEKSLLFFSKLVGYFKKTPGCPLEVRNKSVLYCKKFRTRLANKTCEATYHVFGVLCLKTKT